MLFRSECDSREPRGDVQGADAGPVWESVGQAFACCGEGDVGRVGISQGRYAWLLGACADFFFIFEGEADVDVLLSWRKVTVAREIPAYAG